MILGFPYVRKPRNSEREREIDIYIYNDIIIYIYKVYVYIRHSGTAMEGMVAWVGEGPNRSNGTGTFRGLALVQAHSLLLLQQAMRQGARSGDGTRKTSVTY